MSFPPYGGHDSRKSELVGSKGLTAAARRRGVGVLDRETPAGDGVDEIHLGAAQIPDADRVDVELDAVRLVNLVARALTVLLDHEAVLEARTAAALNEHSQAAACLVFFA